MSRLARHLTMLAVLMWCITAGLLVLALTVAPDAINPALGLGFWAVLVSGSAYVERKYGSKP